MTPDDSDDRRSKEEAHRKNNQRDARKMLDRGEGYQVVVWEGSDDFDGPDALTKIEKVKTFIKCEDLVLRRGDTVHIKILDVGDSHAEAIVVDSSPDYHQSAGMAG